MLFFFIKNLFLIFFIIIFIKKIMELNHNYFFNSIIYLFESIIPYLLKSNLSSVLMKNIFILKLN